MRWFEPDQSHRLDRFQEVSLGLMAAIMLLTFVGTNLQALWWQSSDWLIGTVLPAVVVDLTNNERSDLATRPLQRSPVLDVAAKQKAEHMAANSYFAHFAPDGTSPWHFFEQAGYTYAHAGENLAIHFTDSAEVVDAWMDSPAHRENIANGNFVEIGVGTARGTYDGYETVFVVQLFGAPAVPPAVSEIDVVPESLAVVTADTASDSETAATLASLRAELEAIQQQADVLVVSTSDETAILGVVQQVDSQREPQLIEETNLLTTDRPKEEMFVASEDVLVVETQLSTSSGLAIANIVETAQFTNNVHAGATIASVITRPNLVLDVMYSLLISAVLFLLAIALFGEAKRLHYMQVAYSLMLIAGVGGLWFTHTLLTSGAAIL